MVLPATEPTTGKEIRYVMMVGPDGVAIDDAGAGILRASMMSVNTLTDTGGGHFVISGGGANGSLGAVQMNWNPESGTYERNRNNRDLPALLASAARTATISTADQPNYNGRGVVLYLDVTAHAATPTLTVSVEGKDPVGGKYFPLTAFPALNVAGAVTVAYTFYPGAIESAALAGHEPFGLVVPRTWRATVTHGDADSATNSLGGSLIL
jgi:hypothetical protein